MQRPTVAARPAGSGRNFPRAAQGDYPAAVQVLAQLQCTFPLGASSLPPPPVSHQPSWFRHFPFMPHQAGSQGICDGILQGSWSGYGPEAARGCGAHSCAQGCCIATGNCCLIRHFSSKPWCRAAEQFRRTSLIWLGVGCVCVWWGVYQGGRGRLLMADPAGLHQCQNKQAVRLTINIGPQSRRA